MRIVLSSIAVFLVTASAALAQLQASVLPISRSAVTGEPVTVFATVVGSSSQSMSNCTVTIPEAFPAEFSFQRITTSGPEITFVYTPNFPFSVNNQSSAELLLRFVPTRDFERQEVDIRFICDEGSAPIYSGVNTIFLSSSSVAETDIIPIAVTPQGGGIIQFDRESRRAAFAAAAVNIGAAGDVRVRPSAPNIASSVSLRVCQTNPLDGRCLSAPSDEILARFEAGETRTFTIVVDAHEEFGIPAHYDVTRVFLVFEDEEPDVTPGPYGSPLIPARSTFGATSIAVRAEGPWRQNESGDVFGVHRGTLNGQPALIFMDSFRGGFGIQFNHPADAAVINGTFPLVLGTMDAIGELYEDGNLVLSGGNETIGRYSYTELQEVRGAIGSNTAVNFGVNFRGAYDPSHADISLMDSVTPGSWLVRLPGRQIGQIAIDEDDFISGTITWPVLEGGTETAVPLNGRVSRNATQNRISISLNSATFYYRFTGFVDARPGGNVLTGYVQDVGASVAPGTSTPADFDVIPIELIPDAE